MVACQCAEKRLAEFFHHYVRYSLLAISFAAVAGCGGGGGGGTNTPPQANAGADQHVNEQTTVTLDGSASHDPNGSIIGYFWKQTAGQVVKLSGMADVQPTFTAPDVAKDSTLTFELTATDNNGVAATDTVNIFVKNIPVVAGNTYPLVNPGLLQIVNEGSLVTLDGRGSKDFDGDIVSYRWVQQKNPLGIVATLSGATTATPTFTAPNLSGLQSADLLFELTVTDDRGASSSETVKITVKGAAIVQPTPTGKLNDTGVTLCGNATGNGACPQAGFPGQDAENGRDANQATNNDADGHRGFNFTKISSTGQALPASATAWSCVKDNVTGLIWEVKTNDGGLHDKDWTYTWRDTNPATNGGADGVFNGGVCGGTSQCDTNGYVTAVNAVGWCGAKNWRMPSVNELISITDLSRSSPSIDTGFFPNTVAKSYWSGTAAINVNMYTPSLDAWSVAFGFGGNTDGYEDDNEHLGFRRFNVYAVRLVRSTP